MQTVYNKQSIDHLFLGIQNQKLSESGTIHCRHAPDILCFSSECGKTSLPPLTPQPRKEIPIELSRCQESQKLLSCGEGSQHSLVMKPWICCGSCREKETTFLLQGLRFLLIRPLLSIFSFWRLVLPPPRNPDGLDLGAGESDLRCGFLQATRLSKKDLLASLSPFLYSPPPL